MASVKLRSIKTKSGISIELNLNSKIRFDSGYNNNSDFPNISYYPCSQQNAKMLFQHVHTQKWIKICVITCLRGE